MTKATVVIQGRSLGKKKGMQSVFKNCTNNEFEKLLTKFKS